MQYIFHKFYGKLDFCENDRESHLQNNLYFCWAQHNKTATSHLYHDHWLTTNHLKTQDLGQVAQESTITQYNKKKFRIL